MFFGVGADGLFCASPSSLVAFGPSFDGVKGFRLRNACCGASIVLRRTSEVPLKKRGVPGLLLFALFTARWMALIFFFPSFHPMLVEIEFRKG